MNLYNLLQQKIKSNHLEVNLNPSFHLSKSATEICSGLSTSHFILVNSDTNEHILLSEQEAFVWESLSKNKDIRSMSYAYYTKYGKLPIDFVDKTFNIWIEKGIIIGNMNLYKSLEHRVLRTHRVKSTFSLLIEIVRRACYFTINVNLFTDILNSLNHYILKFFKKETFVLLFAFALLGNAIFISDIFSRPELIFAEILPSKRYVFLIILLTMFSITLHEIAHGIAMRIFGLKVKSSGLQIFFGIPIFFVDSTDMWTRPRWERLFVTSAGVLTNFIIAGISYLFFPAFTGTFLGLIILEFAMINLWNFVMNCIPFIELDGYYILVDLLGIPNIKRKSMNVFLLLLRTREIKKGNLLLLLYFFLSVGSTMFLVYMSYSLYAQRLELIQEIVQI